MHGDPVAVLRPYTESWRDVASKLYAGKSIELREQDITGLVPIGMNPVARAVHVDNI